jgi:hypothetical protein
MENEKCKVPVSHVPFLTFHFSLFIDQTRIRNPLEGSDKTHTDNHQHHLPCGGTTLEIGVNRLDGIPFE